MKNYQSNVAVIIPCFNESQTIEEVIKEYKLYLPKATIYVIDNNCTDNTSEIASKSGAIVLSEKKQGKGNAIKHAFKNIDSNCYVLVDGDGTYPADKVNEMCNIVLNDQADMVIGDRLSSSYFSQSKKILNGLGNRFIRSYINRKFKVNLCDILSGSRILSKKFVDNLPEISDGFEIETEFVLYALKNNLKVAEVVIPYKERPTGSVSKIHAFPDGIKILKTLFKLTSKTRKR